MKKKIYCNECKYYSYTCGMFIADLEDTKNRCTYPENRQWVETPIKREYVWIKSPLTINKNNDCKWFKRGIPQGDKF